MNDHALVLGLWLRLTTNVRSKPQTCVMFNRDEEHKESLMWLSLWENSGPQDWVEVLRKIRWGFRGALYSDAYDYI